MAHKPESGDEPEGSSVTVRSSVETVKVATVGAAQPLGLDPPGSAAELRTATVDAVLMWRLLLKNPPISGVKKSNGAVRVTVSVFPAPAPPGDSLHGIVTPAGVAQRVDRFSGYVSTACSPAWPCAFRSWFARASMPVVSSGLVAP